MQVPGEEGRSNGMWREPLEHDAQEPALAGADRRIESFVATHAPDSRAGDGPRLDADDVGASYGTRHAIDHVTLTIQPRQVTAIIGPSGCGKSTFLRCLNRMHELTPGTAVTGRVLLNGQDMYAPGVDPVQVRRLVGMVFQKANPFPMMSIFDNVVAGLKLRGHQSKRDLEEIAEKALRGAALFDEVKDIWKKRLAHRSPVANSNACALRGRSRWSQASS